MNIVIDQNKFLTNIKLSTISVYTNFLGIIFNNNETNTIFIKTIPVSESKNMESSNNIPLKQLPKIILQTQK